MENPSSTLITENEYIPSGNSPAEVLSLSLYRIDDPMEVQLYVKLKNMSTKTIFGVAVNVKAYDINGKVVFVKRDMRISRQNATADAEFGDDVPLHISSLLALDVEVAVSQVFFADGSVWYCDEKVEEDFPEDDEKEKITDDIVNNLPSNPNLLFTDKKMQREAEKNIWGDYSPPKPRSKWIGITFKFIALALAIIIAWAAGDGYFAKREYNAAMSAFNTRQYEKAVNIFDSISSPFISQKMKDDIKWHTALSCIYTGKYNKSLKFLSELDSKGNSGTCMRQLNAVLKGITSAGEKHSVCLKKDGTVISTGDNSKKQCETQHWNSIISVACAGDFTLGLKDNGTVVTTGDNSFLQCNLTSWSNIVFIDAGENHSVGVTAMGEVLAKGNNAKGQCETGSWSGIVSVSAGTKHTVGLRTDGTVVATGDNEFGACEVGDWTDIVDISAGNGFTVGVKQNGTVLVTGDNSYNVFDGRNLNEVVAVSAGDGYILAIQKNGRVVSVGDNQWHQGDTALWNKVISIGCSIHHSVGVSSDSIAFATGDNKEFQCYTWDWENMGLSEGAFNNTSFGSYGLVLD